MPGVLLAAAAATAPAVPASTLPSTVPAAPASTVGAVTTTVHHSPGNHTAAVVLLLLVAAVLIVGGLVYAIVDRAATEPEWLLRMRHSVGEAGWRVGNWWAEFVDFLHIGR